MVSGFSLGVKLLHWGVQRTRPICDGEGCDEEIVGLDDILTGSAARMEYGDDMPREKELELGRKFKGTEVIRHDGELIVVCANKTCPTRPDN